MVAGPPPRSIVSQRDVRPSPVASPSDQSVRRPVEPVGPVAEGPEEPEAAELVEVVEEWEDAGPALGTCQQGHSRIRKVTYGLQLRLLLLVLGPFQYDHVVMQGTYGVCFELLSLR